MSTLKSNAAKIEDKNIPIKEEEQDEGIKNTPFTKEQLEKLWKTYTESIRQEGKRSESIILDRSFDLDNGLTIKLKLDNFVQLDLLNTFKPDLLKHIRQGLNNNQIGLEAVISQDEEVKLIYTSNDKFKFLCQKYPILEEMKKRLGLDSDF